ncbi:hypothetical protein FACS189459_1860 [Bacilli bacterium]|nr:hypothetical protein FACS189459_1860 [Bacilli bacterium]
MTRCNDNKNVSVNLITSNGEANLKTTTALTLAFNGSNAIQNLVGTDFSITGENGSGTDVTIASVSSADGHTYIINIKGIIEEGEKVKIIVNDIAGYKIAQYNTAITLHVTKYTADGKN